MILAWNAVALEANRVSHSNGLGEQTGPTLSSRALAIVHLAMYDAYVGASGSALHPYLATTIPTAGLDVDAAIAGAAYGTLISLFPKQITSFDVALALVGITPATQASYDYGFAIANAMIANRAGDPSADDSGYVGSKEHGKHRPAPDAENGKYHAPFYGERSIPFSANRNFEIDAFPPILDPGPADPVLQAYYNEYKASFNQVKEKGIKPELGSTRTNDETLMGMFWAYDGALGLGTPPRLYNQIIRQIVIQQGAAMSMEQQVTLFALVNVAMGDAGIFAWREKYRHNIWRPVLGIREHNASMAPLAVVGENPVDEGDCLWLPLGSPKTNVTNGRNFTPDFPAYPSGHATFGAAAFNMAELYFSSIGINPFAIPLDFVSEELNGINRDNTGAVRPRHVRRFNSFRQMIDENGFSRVYLGVHWSLDAFALDAAGEPDYTRNVGGAMLGLDLAEHIFNRFRNGVDGIDQA